MGVRSGLTPLQRSCSPSPLVLSELFHPTRASLEASGCFLGARGALRGPGVGGSSGFGALGRGSSRAFAHELGAFLGPFYTVDVGFVLWSLVAALELGTGLPSPPARHAARFRGGRSCLKR